MNWRELFERKPVELLKQEAEGGTGLHRVLGLTALTNIGIGGIIGAGIFVLVGKVAHEVTGPALMLSFVVAGMTCAFAALCYAEFAAMTPVAGSAYTYAYASLGELMAWIIGWDLILEYAVSSAAVAHSWSRHFQDFLLTIGEFLHLDPKWVTIPQPLAGPPYEWSEQAGQYVSTGNWFDFPAFAIIALLTVILVKGVKESTFFNTVMVVVKVSVVLFVIAVGCYYGNLANWTPFAPYGFSGVSFFGHTVLGQSGPKGEPLGMLAGAAIIFFAYIGFDGVSAHSEEAKNPQRDIPRAIIISLAVCTVLYILFAGALMAMVPYNQIDSEAPVPGAMKALGMNWARLLIDIGAVAGMTSVLLVGLLSQPRIFFPMARDGLLPPMFAKLHPRFGTPVHSTILTGSAVALMGCLLPLHVLAELVSIGTLLAFAIVCGAVLMMRYTHPSLPRPFRCPGMPVVPILGVALCLLLMFSLGVDTWIRLIVWLAIGLAIYFLYGRKRSILAQIRAKKGT